MNFSPSRDCEFCGREIRRHREAWAVRSHWQARRSVDSLLVFNVECSCFWFPVVSFHESQRHSTGKASAWQPAAYFMDNYFNYFTEIEEHFQRRRGGILLLSTLDWALIEIWKDAGIPLEAVLRGVDTAFDRYEQRPSKTKKVNSLAYCAQEVLTAVEDIRGGGRNRDRGEARPRVRQRRNRSF